MGMGVVIGVQVYGNTTFRDMGGVSGIWCAFGGCILLQLFRMGLDYGLGSIVSLSSAVLSVLGVMFYNYRSGSKSLVPHGGAMALGMVFSWLLFGLSQGENKAQVLVALKEMIIV